MSVNYVCDVCDQEIKVGGDSYYCCIKGEEAMFEGKGWDLDLCHKCFKDITKDKLIKLLKA